MDAAARRDRVTRLAGELPEAAVDGAEHLAFRVRGKTFAYLLDDHHGDGILGICAKAAPGEAAARAAADPARYYVPAYLGPKGWVGLRVDGAAVDWDEVAGVLVDAYRLVAPKRLAALL